MALEIGEQRDRAGALLAGGGLTAFLCSLEFRDFSGVEGAAVIVGVVVAAGNGLRA